MNTAQRFRPEVNEAYAAVVSAYYATRAAQMGTTPQELYQRRPLLVRAQGLGGDVLGQALASQPPKGWVHSTSGQDAAALYNGDTQAQAVFWTDLQGRLAQDAPELAGYSHSLDRSRADHIRRNHGDVKAEAGRGQIAVTGNDMARIPEIVTDYDAISTNVPIKNEQGNQTLRGVVFAKKFDDGVVVYTGVVSRKRRDLRGATMWKYPPTTDAQTAIKLSTSDLTSETLGGMGSSVDENGEYFQFAGQQAATADHYALANAAAMESVMDMEDIRQQTGWHKGNDGKWRFEISDADAKLKIGHKGVALGQLVDEKKYPNAVMPLGDVLDHPALFAAYPGLADLRVAFVKQDPNGGERGSFSVRDGVGRIQLNDSMAAHEALSTLLHEIQHGIQSIEGFATGGSADNIATAQDAARAAIPGLRAEVREAQREYDDAVDMGYPDAQIAQRKAALEKAQTALDADLSLADGGNPSDQYRRLAGEVEARNTQARALMSDRERQLLPPAHTADVKDADVIVTFNGKDAASAPVPANAMHQGPRGTFSPEQLTISLLKKADLSTFLHESGHFFFDNDIALASEILAAQQQGASITAGERQMLGHERRA